MFQIIESVEDCREAGMHHALDTRVTTHATETATEKVACHKLLRTAEEKAWKLATYTYSQILHLLQTLTGEKEYNRWERLFG